MLKKQRVTVCSKLDKHVKSLVKSFKVGICYRLQLQSYKAVRQFCEGKLIMFSLFLLCSECVSFLRELLLWWSMKSLRRADKAADETN